MTRKRPLKIPLKLAVLAPLAAGLLACASVKVEGGEKPVEVNLNVNVSGEVLVRLEREIEDAIAQNPNIF